MALTSQLPPYPVPGKLYLLPQGIISNPSWSKELDKRGLSPPEGAGQGRMELPEHCWLIPRTPRLLLLPACRSQVNATMSGMLWPCCHSLPCPREVASLRGLSLKTSVEASLNWVSLLYLRSVRRLLDYFAFVTHRFSYLSMFALFICRVGSTDNFVMKLLFPFIIALLALVLLLLVLQHSFS